jgi:hypothetical protein
MTQGAHSERSRFHLGSYSIFYMYRYHGTISERSTGLPTALQLYTRPITVQGDLGLGETSACVSHRGVSTSEVSPRSISPSQRKQDNGYTSFR